MKKILGIIGVSGLMILVAATSFSLGQVRGNKDCVSTEIDEVDSTDIMTYSDEQESEHEQEILNEDQLIETSESQDVTEDSDSIKDEIKKVHNKWYCFDADGVMKVGLVAVKDRKYVYTIQNVGEDIWASTKDLMKAKEDGYSIMYFDEETGARITGTTTIELKDGEYTMRFYNSGEAIDGKRQGCLYEAGILLKAGKFKKYQEFTVNGVVYKVDREGKIQE